MINTQSSLAAEAGPTARMVRFRASDGLLLHGLLLGDFEKVVVHVHGKCGNHYENRFLWDLAQAYSDVNIGLFLFGNRGANALTEAYGPSGLTYIGGAIERFAESVLDIDGAIAALTELGFSAVVLQGHSFGCEKVVNWARTISEVSIPLVLLSPADSYGNLQEFLDSKDTLSKEAGDRSEVPGLLQIAWSYDQSLCPYGVVDRDGNWYPGRSQSI